MTKNYVVDARIKNSADKDIAAVIHYPEPPTDRLAILCPGYLDTKDYPNLVKLAKTLVLCGCTVVRFDPSGTWGSEGSISDYLTSQYLDDIRSILEYMLGQKNYAHIILGGHSRGGMVSILYAAQDPRISLVLGIMPSSGRPLTPPQLEEWERNGFSISLRDIPGSSEQKEFKVPYAYIIDRNNFNVVEEVKKVHVPIILMAGELDDIVPQEDVKRIFDQANEPKRFVLLNGIGHDYRRNPTEIDTVNEMTRKNVGSIIRELGWPSPRGKTINDILAW